MGNKKEKLMQKQLKFINTLMFETPGGLRFTQDSPILPNVWLAFAIEPRSQQEMILTVNNKSGTGEAAFEIRKLLNALRKKRPTIGGAEGRPRERARVSYIPGQIAVKLYFDELMRVILPLTQWWHKTYDALRKIERSDEYGKYSANWIPFPQPDPEKKRERDLVDALMLMRREIDQSVNHDSDIQTEELRKNSRYRRRHYIREIPPDLTWLVRVAGVIGDCFASDANLLSTKDCISSALSRDFKARQHDRIETFDERNSRLDEIREKFEKALNARKNIVRAFVQLYENWCPDSDYPSDRHIWRITKNRRVHLAVEKSALTVKADAARRLFNISCQGITWAVLDSGIDSKHPAFKQTSSDYELEVRRKNSKEGDALGLAPEISIDDLERTRVIKTLDFTQLRELLDFDIEIDADDDEAKKRKAQLEKTISIRMSRFDCGDAGGQEREPTEKTKTEAKLLLKNLRQRIAEGKDIDWEDLEQAIVVHDPETPSNDHGTHVAGVLGADWIERIPSENKLPLALRTRRMRGVCPDINLIDVRVFREDGLTDEFELLAAVQFLRWMNSRAGTMQVHGANLSLSLIHEVRRFACGQTPICDECNEASALGMVIVAAAGNRGFEMTETETVKASDSYKSVSITDPGNAEKVITVGATHRKRPHEYGVSYFSSRGPTGDGRCKPDLVAPGEKIKGPTPNERAEYKDGTSMAAPHVSGAAAMLMARHSELIAQPERVKAILCENATDLGRERYFQGHGLVDALRALQSV